MKNSNNKNCLRRCDLARETPISVTLPLTTLETSSQIRAFRQRALLFLCKHAFNPLVVQGASLIKGKIFSSGSFDSSVNDVPGTKRFNIGGFGERKERACKVRPPRI